MLNLKSLSLIVFFTIATIGQALAQKQCTAAVYKCKDGDKLSGSNCSTIVPSKFVCGQGYWEEFTASSKKCVKQACAAGSMPGVSAWAAIGGYANGGEYKSDDKGGSRFYLEAAVFCPLGFKLSGNDCVKSYPAKLVTPAVCKLDKSSVK